MAHRWAGVPTAFDVEGGDVEGIQAPSRACSRCTAIAQLGSGWRLAPPHGNTKERAFAFWYDNSGAEQVELPQVCSDGLVSAVRKGDFEVHLLCYQRFQKLPTGVCAVSCTDLLPYADFKSLLAAGVPVPLCADYIRLKALSHHCGWFIDCDTLWCRPPTVTWDGPCYGHVFGSMEAGRNVFRVADSTRQWNLHYLRRPGDQLFIASPFRIPSGSPLLKDFVSWFSNLFGQVSTGVGPSLTMGYDIAMKKCFELVQVWGLEEACRDPEEFSVVPRWFTKQRCFRTMKKDESAILAKIREFGSVGVNVFWQSTRGGKTPDYEGMLPDSLWDKILTIARTSNGPKRRRVCGKALLWPVVPALGQVAFPSMSPPLASELIKKFRLNEEIAKGAYGVVYSGLNLQTNKVVAVKVVVDKQGRCEGRELYFLKHVQGSQFVVALYDGFTSPFWTAIVTELLRCSLDQYRKELGGVPLPQAVGIASNLAQALAHIHKLHILHRDVHAGNVLLRFLDSDRAVVEGVLCDFGLSSHIDDEGVKLKHRSGNITQSWSRAPERFFAPGSGFDARGKWIPPFDAKYGASVDIWGWGVVTMSMPLKEPLYGGASDQATAMNLAKVFGFRHGDLPAWNTTMTSLNAVYLLPVRGKWPRTFQGIQYSVLDETLQFDPSRRPPAAEIVRFWNSMGG